MCVYVCVCVLVCVVVCLSVPVTTFNYLLVLPYCNGCSGNLMTRSLNDVVTETDVVTGSEYLQTSLVVVPKSLYREWEKSYETIAEMIVPRSSR